MKNITKLLLNSLYGIFGKKDYSKVHYFAIPEWDLLIHSRLNEKPRENDKVGVNVKKD